MPIRLEEDADHLTLAVEDNGKGITQQEIVQGSSLGLLRMRERALLLGGEFTVVGRPGDGTTVTVRIPLTAQHLQGFGGQDEKPAPLVGGRS